MNDILEKLRGLGLSIDFASNVEKKDKSNKKVEDIFNGQWKEVNDQRIFIEKKTYPFGEKHGDILIENFNANEKLSLLLGIPEIKDLELEDFIFLDTETSGLNIGSGSLVFLFGCCFFNHQGLEIRQLFIDHPYHELLLLSTIDDLLSGFKVLISYNGKSFDIPILKNRFALIQLDHHLNSRIHIDLLHQSRKLWKYDLESKKLSDIEFDILKIKRDQEEVPGWLIPQIYMDFVQYGETELLKGVFYHNEIDVVSLAALFLKISHMLMNDEFTGNESISFGEMFQKQKDYKLSEEYFQKALENTQDKLLRKKVLLSYAFVLKKQSKLYEAMAIFDKLARKNNFHASIELSKYYEHKSRDFPTALQWAKKSRQILEQQKNVNSKLIEKTKERIERLERKMKD